MAKTKPAKRKAAPPKSAKKKTRPAAAKPVKKAAPPKSAKKKTKPAAAKPVKKAASRHAVARAAAPRAAASRPAAPRAAAARPVAPRPLVARPSLPRPAAKPKAKSKPAAAPVHPKVVGLEPLPPGQEEHYARPDLEYFRSIIGEQRLEAVEELESLSERLMDTMTGEYVNENSPYSLHMAEQGTDAMEREKAFLQAQRTNDYIKKLDEALKRIDEGTYGVCVICNRLIEKQRLIAVPVTQKHVSCKNLEAEKPQPPKRENEPLHHFPETNS
jgi:RNA polymerase-binding transcription factor DksA